MECNTLDHNIQQQICKFFAIQSLKEHQITVLEKILIERMDCLVVLPCGMGKSMVFEAIPVAKSALNCVPLEMLKC